MPARLRCELGLPLVGALLLTACGADPTPKVLVIGIDGVRPDVLAEVPTPNLDALAAEGFFADDARTTDPTVSGPAWSSLLIGVWPEKHNVYGNQFAENRYDLYPDFLTRIEQLRPELATFVAADWPPLVTEDAGGPLVGDLPDVKVALDGYDLGWAAADSSLTDAAVAHLGSADPDALFVYLGEPDEVSHATRSIGDEYRQAIARADRAVGRLVEAVRARATYAEEDWLILVSTDHGRREDGGHGGESPEERTIFFLAHGPSVVPSGGGSSGAGPAAADPLADPPRIVDVAVTALTHLGIVIDPAWGLDGRAVGLIR